MKTNGQEFSGIKNKFLKYLYVKYLKFNILCFTEYTVSTYYVDIYTLLDNKIESLNLVLENNKTFSNFALIFYDRSLNKNYFVFWKSFKSGGRVLTRKAPDVVGSIPPRVYFSLYLGLQILLTIFFKTLLW